MRQLPNYLSKPYIILASALILLAILFAKIECGSIYFFDLPENDAEFPVVKVHRLFDFDPNMVSVAEMDSLGFPRRVLHNLVKYREHNGQFRIKQDIRKIYGFTDSMFNRFEPFIDLPDERPIVLNKNWKRKEPNGIYRDVIRKKKKPEPKIVDINTASQDELYVPQYVGKRRAEEILKYREILGGFYSVEQLGEIWCFADSIIPELQRSYYCHADSLTKAPIASMSYQRLVSHPYIDKYQAKHIVQANKISSKPLALHDLLINHILDSLTYSRLKHYMY